MPPETIAGRYRVEREVGRGGMGAVWLCRDELLGRSVAVKQVGHLPGESTPDLARALREARSSAPLNHRNVVSVYDAIDEGDSLWLVMEYVPGRTLSEVMSADGPLSPERVAWIGAQVADGLAAAHARGTVHRDVKPGNILLTDDDQAKISDFGIARTLGDAQLTQSGLVTGTPAYFSPDLAKGNDPTKADDVWALGASLYAAVEGRAPYPEQRNAIAMLTTIASGRPPQPVQAGFLTDAIGRMLDPDAGSRWSMADAAHALHRLHEKNLVVGTRESEVVPAPTAALPAVPSPTPDPVAGSTTDAVADSTHDLTEGTRDRPWLGRAALVVLGAALLALVLGVGFLLLDPGGDDSSQVAGTSPGPDRTPSGGRSGKQSQSPSAQPSPSQSSAPESSPAPTQSTQPPPASGSRSDFVESYYGVLPDDTRTGWSLLSPESQAAVGSYGSYQGFWSTIRAVTVDDTTPSADEPDAVDVTITYTGSDGRSEQEVRRLSVEPSGDSYLITDEGVVG